MHQTTITYFLDRTKKNRLPDAPLMLQYVIQENNVRYIMTEVVNNET